MPTRRSITVTPRSDGGWAVVSGKTTVSTHRRKDTAVAAGRRHAKRQVPSRLTIKGNNGRIQDQRSYESPAKSATGRSGRRSPTRGASKKSPSRARSGSRATSRRTASKQTAASRARRASRQTVGDIMTPNPQTLPMTASLREAANTMRMVDAGTVLISDEQDRLMGILTDRDIAIRAVADGLDPLSTSVGDISSPYPETVSPGTSIREAVKLMRQLDIRRLPVTEGDRPVGILSLGDLAIFQDPASVLADISAAPSTDRPSAAEALSVGAMGGVAVVEVDTVPSAQIDMRVEGPGNRR